VSRRDARASGVKRSEATRRLSISILERCYTHSRRGGGCQSKRRRLHGQRWNMHILPQKRVLEFAENGQLVEMRALLEEHPELDVDGYKDRDGRGALSGRATMHTAAH
jgi:hypothetical protein